MLQRYFVFATCWLGIVASSHAQPLWQIELRYDQQSIQIESVVPMDSQGRALQPRVASSHANTEIQLRNVDGDTLFQTYIPDPRVIRAPFSLDGQHGHAYALAEPDTLTILVPAHPDAERLSVVAPIDPLQPIQNQQKIADTVSVRILAASIPINEAFSTE